MKFISNFNISNSDLQATKATRPFSISGNSDAFFDLQITNEAGKFYNFITQTFTNATTSTSSTVSADVNSNTIYITTANANIKPGMVVTGSGVSSHVFVRSVSSQTIILSDVVDVAAGGALKFTAKASLSKEKIGKSGNYTGKIVFPTVTSNDTYTVLLEASISDETELKTTDIVYDTDVNSDTYGQDITHGFTNKLFKSISISQHVDTTITINASSPALTALDVDYSANSFTIVKPRNFKDAVGFKTSFTWTFTTTSASAITKSQTLVDTFFETTKTQTVNGATSSSKSVVLDSVENLVVGMFISGTGFGGGDTIVDIDTTKKRIIFSGALRSVSDGITLTFTGKGSRGARAYGSSLSFTNLTTTLTPLTVTVATTSDNSTTLALSSAAFIQDGTTTVIKGIGIDVDESTTNIATRAAGSNDITLSSAKTVAAGTVLEVEGSSSAITITGDVMLHAMGNTNFTSTLQIDDFVGIGVS